MKIGILQCCSVMPQFQKQFGDYPSMFINLFKEINPNLQFETYDLRENMTPTSLNECDAYITTGSRVSTYDTVDWIPVFKRLIIDLNDAQIKLVGVCFGHQLIADCLGGETRLSDKGWGVGVSINPVKKKKSWMKPALDQLNIVVSHQDQVIRLPENTEVLAGSDFCPNFMLQIGGHILTLQGHPEFSKQYSQTLMQHREDIIGRDRLQQGLKSISLPVHDKIMMQWIYQFMRS